MDNCIFNFTSLNLSLTLNLSLEVYSSTCVLAKHSALEAWKLQQQPENQVTWKFGMLSMNWDAFDGIRKKNSRCRLKPGEDPTIFLWNLKELFSRADPSLEENAHEAMLSRQFM